MRKLFLGIFLLVASQSFAATTVTIVWPFGVGSTLLNYTRALVHKANQDQDRYNFVIDLRPGAGGSIGAFHVVNLVGNGNLALLASSDAFFIRPMLYPKSTRYSLDDFRLILPQVIAPMALVSKSDEQIENILQKQQSNIGTTGLGTSTHVMAEQVRRRALGMQIIPYKDPPEAVKEVMNGNIDLALETLSLALNNPKIKIHGITGKQKIDGIQNLTEIGFTEMGDMDIKAMLLASRKMDVTKFKEIQTILLKAQKDNAILNEAIKMNRGTPIDIDPKNYDLWFQSQIRIFQTFTKPMDKLE